MVVSVVLAVLIILVLIIPNRIMPEADQVISSKREAYIVREYGLTSRQYNLMLEMQNGACAICRKPPTSKRLAIDHDHRTGRVRALLCWRCNKLLMGVHTVTSAKRVLELLDSDFDGRKL